MKKLLKILVWMSGILILIILAFLMVGMFASKNFEGSKTEVINSPATIIWKNLTDIEKLPARRREVLKVEILGKNKLGLPKWKEYTDMEGYIVYDTKERIENKKLKIEMVESTFGMSGYWVYELKALTDSTTEVKISENSTIHYLPTLSIMAIAGRDANIQKEFELIRLAKD